MYDAFLAVPNRTRVIVERQSDNRWVATLPGIPKLAASARFPFAAICNLFNRVGDRQLTINSLRPVESQMRNDHLEFEIQRSDWPPATLAN